MVKLELKRVEIQRPVYAENEGSIAIPQYNDN